MKQMNETIIESVGATVIIVLLIVTGTLLALAEENTDVSKVVFYVS